MVEVEVEDELSSFALLCEDVGDDVVVGVGEVRSCCVVVAQEVLQMFEHLVDADPFQRVRVYHLLYQVV